ncbi:MAG: hypothetical protein QG663_1656, partial [Thermodesulfobacteriota bacterium]|nr:hypothetical protein [Thermodesulfobacteriota bacterium]
RGRGPIAQLVELPAHNRSVPGSNPGGPTIFPEVLMRHEHIIFLLDSFPRGA